MAKALHSVHKANLYTELDTGGTIGWKEHCRSFEALQRVHARFRAIGITMLRVHSDRAREFLSRSVRSWIASPGLYQTTTSGDDPPANGRAEAEVQQIKRSLRLVMRASGAPVEEWPSVGRHAAEERLRRQLNVVGMKTTPTLPATRRKKWWNRITEKAQNLSSLFWQATIKGPSPLMTHGWCVLTSTKKVQHARAVISTDPNLKSDVGIGRRPQEIKRALDGKTTASRTYASTSVGV